MEIIFVIIEFEIMGYKVLVKESSITKYNIVTKQQSQLYKSSEMLIHFIYYVHTPRQNRLIDILPVRVNLNYECKIKRITWEVCTYLSRFIRKLKVKDEIALILI